MAGGESGVWAVRAPGAGHVDGAPSARPPPQGQGAAAAAGGGSPTSADSAGSGEQSQAESRHHVGFRTNGPFTTNCPCCCVIEREPPWEGLLLMPLLYACSNVFYLVLVCEIVYVPQALWSHDSSVVRAQDSCSKGRGFKPWQERQEIFLLMSVSLLILILVPIPPKVTVVAC